MLQQPAMAGGQTVHTPQSATNVPIDKKIRKLASECVLSIIRNNFDYWL